MFHKFFSDHEDHLQQLAHTHDAGVREDIEREVERLVARMHSKGLQIDQLKKHLEKVVSNLFTDVNVLCFDELNHGCF